MAADDNLQQTQCSDPSLSQESATNEGGRFSRLEFGPSVEEPPAELPCLFVPRNANAWSPRASLLQLASHWNLEFVALRPQCLGLPPYRRHVSSAMPSSFPWHDRAHDGRLIVSSHWLSGPSQGVILWWEVFCQSCRHWFPALGNDELWPGAEPCVPCWVHWVLDGMFGPCGRKEEWERLALLRMDSQSRGVWLG